MQNYKLPQLLQVIHIQTRLHTSTITVYISTMIQRGL